MANTFNRRDIGLTDASRTVGDFFASLLTNVNMPSLDEWADAVDFAKQYSYEENDGISILLMDEIQKKLAD